MTDSNRASIWGYLYDGFGQIQGGGAIGGYTFTGREWDPETGLYYYRARYYDPRLGRFISEDPILWAGGENFYSYVKNRPATLSDPQGLQSSAPYYITYWQSGHIRTPYDPTRPPDFYSLVCQYIAAQFGVAGGEGIPLVVSGGAVGPKGCGCFLTANWLNQSTAPTATRKLQFVIGRSYTLGGSVIAAAQVTWTPGSGTATGFGVGTPGWGLGGSSGVCTACPGPSQNLPPGFGEWFFWRSHGY